MVKIISVTLILISWLFFIQCSPSKPSQKSESEHSAETQWVEKSLYINEALSIQYIDQLSSDLLKGGQEIFTGTIYRAGNEPFTFLALYVNDSTSYPLIGNKDFLKLIDSKQGENVTLAGKKIDHLKKQAIQVEFFQK